MPELAEVKLMTEFFNLSAGSKRFRAIHKSHESKIKIDLSLTPTDVDGFKVKAYSRGKESIIVLTGAKSGEECRLMITYGMSGHWRTVKHSIDIPNHSHLMFEAFDGSIICLVDARRFAKWKWVKGWSSSRGPDPVFEFDKFKENILLNLNKPIFNNPIHIVLMNQKYFNGVGNYIRSEVIGRISELNPFIDAKTAIQNHPEILDLCKEIPLKAYLLGGGQLKDWKNSLGTPDTDFKNFIQFYGNKERCIPIKDKNGRTFWCDKKWI